MVEWLNHMGIRRRLPLLAACLLVTAFAWPARADPNAEDPTRDWPVHLDPPPPPKPEPAPPPRMTDEVRYDGVPFAITDAAAVAVLIWARVDAKKPFLFADGLGDPWRAPRILGTALFLGPSPLTHTLNGRPINALASLLVRSGAPVVGTLAGVVIGALLGNAYGCTHPTHGSPDQSCGGKEFDSGATAGADIGALAGAAVAMWFDHGTLAVHDLTPGAKHPAVAWTPQLAASTDRVSLGVGARF